MKKDLLSAFRMLLIMPHRHLKLSPLQPGVSLLLIKVQQLQSNPVLLVAYTKARLS